MKLRYEIVVWAIVLIHPVWSDEKRHDVELKKQSTLLLAESGRQRRIKVLEVGAEFQGAALTKKHGVFLAYTDKEAEATTTLSLYDVRRHKEQVVVVIGLTGSSEFEYDKFHDVLVFSWMNGIHWVRLNDLSRLLEMPWDRRSQAFEKAIVNVELCDTCNGPIIIRADESCYYDYKKEPRVRKCFSLPPEPVSSQESTRRTNP